MTDFSFEAHIIKTRICEATAVVEAAWTAPHVLYRPVLSQDGDQWCALYGENLAEGIAGFGDTPADAMKAFDKAWASQLTNSATLSERHPSLKRTVSGKVVQR